MGRVVGPQSCCQGCGAEQGEGKGLSPSYRDEFQELCFQGGLVGRGLSPSPAAPLSRAPRPKPPLISGSAAAQAMDSQADVPRCTGLGRRGSSVVAPSASAGLLGPPESSCQPRGWVRAAACGLGSALDLNAM